MSQIALIPSDGTVNEVVLTYMLNQVKNFGSKTFSASYNYKQDVNMTIVIYKDI